MLKNYFIIALRNFWKHKSFTIINLAGLAIAMACAILIYLFIHQELSFDQFHAHQDRIYKVAAVEHNFSTGTESYMVTQPYPLGPAMQEDLPEIESVVRLSYRKPLFVKKGTDIYQEDFILADNALFEVFSFPIIYGNTHQALNQPQAVAISETAAKKYFGDGNPVGEVLSIRLGQNFEDYQVTAVFKDIPANSSIRSDFFLSLVQENARKAFEFLAQSQYDPWDVEAFKTYVLLHEQASLAVLEQKLAAFREKYYPTETHALQQWEKEKGEKIARAYYLQPLADMHLNTAIVDLDALPSKPVYAYILGGIAFSILLLLSSGYIKLIFIALLIAIPVANYFVTEWLQGFAYRIVISWWLFALSGVFVLWIASLSVGGQTLKAARRNPVDSLRYE